MLSSSSLNVPLFSSLKLSSTITYWCFLCLDSPKMTPSLQQASPTLHYPLLVAIQTTHRLQIFLKNWKSIHSPILQWEEPRHREIKSSVLGRKPPTEYFFFVHFFSPAFITQILLRYFCFLFLASILFDFLFFFLIFTPFIEVSVFLITSSYRLFHKRKPPRGCIKSLLKHPAGPGLSILSSTFVPLFSVPWIHLSLVLSISH